MSKQDDLLVFRFNKSTPAPGVYESEGAEKFRVGYRRKRTSTKEAPIEEYRENGKLVRVYHDKSYVPKYDSTDIMNAMAVGAAGMALIVALIIKFYLG
jgi:hypothetical protein